MGQFLYFVPECSKRVVNRHDIGSLGLGLEERLGTEEISCQWTENGPSDTPGLMMIRDPAPDQRPVYRPGEQDWVCWGKFWLGVSKEHRPGPEDLERQDAMVGYWVKLGDGQTWHVPVYRRHTGETGLPYSISRGPDGEFQRETCPAFREFERTGERLFEWYQWTHGGEKIEGAVAPEPITAEEQYEIAANALRMNYRLGDAEIGMLNLLVAGGGPAHNTVTRVLWALIDLKTLLAAQEAASKKKAIGA